MDVQDIRECLDGLRSTRITERKNAAKKWLDYMQDERVLRLLNHARATGPTWNDAFCSATEYLKQEVEKMEKDRAKGVNMRNKDFEIRISFSLVRQVVETADKARPFVTNKSRLLTPEYVIAFFLDGLRQMKFLSADFAAMLPNSLLSVTAYARKLDDQYWKELLEAVTAMYLRFETDDHRKSAAVALEAVIRRSSEYRNLVPLYERVLFPFFANVFCRDCGIEKNPTLARHLVSSLRHFFKLVAETSPNQLVALGEKVHGTVIGCGKAVVSRDSVVAYFRVFLAVKSSLVGFSLNESDVTWRNQLRSLRRFLLADFDSCLTRISSPHETSVNPFVYWSVDWFLLTADVLKMIPDASVDGNNTTLTATSDETTSSRSVSTTADSGPSRKRMRLDESFDFKNLGPRLRSCANQGQLGLLCKLIECVALRHPTIMESSEWLPICADLTEVLVRRIGTLDHVPASAGLRTLAVLLKLLDEAPRPRIPAPTPGSDGTLPDAPWRSIHDSFLLLSDKVFKSVVSSKAFADGHFLLKMFVEKNVIPGKPSPFQVFASANFPPTIEAVETLACLLRRFPLPAVIACPVGTTQYSRRGRPSREFFVEWLLQWGPSRSADCAWFEADPDVLSTTLVALSLKNPRNISFCINDWWWNPWTDENPASAAFGLRFLGREGTRASSAAANNKELKRRGLPEVTPLTYDQDVLVAICSKLFDLAKSVTQEETDEMSQLADEDDESSCPAMSPVAKTTVALWLVVQHLLAATASEGVGAYSHVRGRLKCLSTMMSLQIVRSVKAWRHVFVLRTAGSSRGLGRFYRKTLAPIVALTSQLLAGIVEFKRRAPSAGLDVNKQLVEVLLDVLLLKEAEETNVDPTQRRAAFKQSGPTAGGKVGSRYLSQMLVDPQSEPAARLTSYPQTQVDLRSLKLALVEILSAFEALTAGDRTPDLADALAAAVPLVEQVALEAEDDLVAFQMGRARDMQLTGSRRVTTALCDGLVNDLKEFCKYFCGGDDDNDNSAMQQISLFVENLVPMARKCPETSLGVTVLKEKILPILLEDVHLGKYSWETSERLIKSSVRLYELMSEKNVDARDIRLKVLALCRATPGRDDVVGDGDVSNEAESAEMTSKRRLIRRLAYGVVASLFKGTVPNREWDNSFESLKGELEAVAAVPAPVLSSTSEAAKEDFLLVQRETVIAGYISLGRASVAFRPHCLSSLLVWAAENPTHQAQVVLALSALSEELGYKTLRGFAGIHMEVVMKHWFGKRKTWRMIPAEVVGWPTFQEFVRHHARLLVLLTWELGALSELKTLSEELGKPVPELSKEAYPDLLVRFHLIDLSQARGEVITRRKTGLNGALKQVEASVPSVDQLMEKLTWQVLVAAYGSLEFASDPSLDQYSRRGLPPPITDLVKQPVVLSSVKAILKTDGTAADSEFPESLLLKKPEDLLRALNGLYRGFYESQGSFERLTWCYRFVSLFEHLELGKRTHVPCVPLLTKFVGSVVRHALDRASWNVGDRWDVKARELLTALLKSSLLSEAFRLDKAGEVRDDVASNPSDIEAAVRDLVGRPLTKNSMKQLHDKLLLPGKNALKRLFGDPRRRGKVFSENGGVLQAAVKALADVVASSENPEMRMLAARCLGLFGPGDLRTLVFDDERRHGCERQAICFPEDVNFICFDVLLKHGLLSHDPSSISRAIETLVVLFAEKPARLQLKIWQTSPKLNCLEFSKLMTCFLHLNNVENRGAPQTVNSATSSDGHERGTYVLDQMGSRQVWAGSSDDHKHWIRRVFAKIQESNLLMLESLPHDDDGDHDRDRDHGSSAAQHRILHHAAEFALGSGGDVAAIARIFPFAVYDGMAFQADLPAGNPFIKIQQYMSRGVNRFLEEHCRLVDEGRSSAPVAAVNVESISVVLDTIQKQRTIQGRLRSKASTLDVCLNEFVLRVNYLHAARAAQHCSAFLTSMMFLELEVDKWMREVHKSTRSGIRWVSSDSDSPVGLLLATGQDFPRTLLQLLMKAYRSIGDEDGVHGCLQVADLDEDDQAYAEALELGHDWSCFLAFSDRSKNVGGASRALKKAGLFETVAGITRAASMTDAFDDGKKPVLGLRFEAAWRLGRWGDADDLLLEDAGVGLDARTLGVEGHMHKHVFESFVSFMGRDQEAFKDHVASALRAAADDPALKALEACATVYPALGRLEAVLNLEDVWNLTNPVTAKAVLDGWQLEDEIPARFADREMASAVRISGLCCALNCLAPEAGLHGELRHALCKTLLSLADTAAKASRPEVALNALASVARHAGTSDEFGLIECQGKLLEAKVCRLTKAGDRGKKILKGLQSKVGSHPLHLADVLIHYAEWMSELLAEPPNAILEKLGDAIAVLKGCLAEQAEPDLSESIQSFTSAASTDLTAVGDRMAHAHVVYAKVADARYRQLVAQWNSEEFQEKRDRVNEGQMQDKANAFSAVCRASSNFARNVHSLDKAEVDRVEDEKTEMMAAALTHYGEAVYEANNGEHDLRVFRFVALWIEGKKNPRVLAEAGKVVDKLPSHKFLPVLPQLAAHLTGGTPDEAGFAGQLKKLLGRCAKEFPHHVLPTIVALENGDIIDESKIASTIAANSPAVATPSTAGSTDGSAKASGPKSRFQTAPAPKETNPVESQSRVAGAAQLLQALSVALDGTVSDLGKHIDEYRQFSLKLIRLAYLDKAARAASGGFEIPPDYRLPNNLKYTAVVTKTVPVYVMGSFASYKGPPLVGGYGPTFDTVGGINTPKKLVCRGSDGVNYPQLLKGNDDLRQDAVMQQVFGAVNSLFAAAEDPEITQLRLRTYKVVPLCPRSGLLEWCESAQTLSSYLIGSSASPGAHVRLRHNDWSPQRCMAELKDAYQRPDAVKVKAFKTVCENFQPVFRHFMFENFRSPSKWYERRQAYTKSVAASSIVGYVLGLGDRHVNNIMIDKDTAEIVHIDFGIAFEKGLTLPTPELVPFRLTRDIVDGMGVLGVSGTFQRSCERVMKALRESAGEVILTVLEVLLWDPLYEWDLSEGKLLHLMGEKFGSGGVKPTNLARKNKAAAGASGGPKKKDELGEKNAIASRALGKVQAKLQGLVDGHPMSVSGQIAYLIQQARSPENLARIYYGWQPYL